MEKLLKALFIHASDENYPKNAVYLYVENGPAMKRNEAVLNDFPIVLYKI